MKLKSVTANLMVDDVQATVKFYTEMLGFKQVVAAGENDSAWALVKHEGAELMFQQVNSLNEEYPDLSSKVPGGGFTLFIDVENIEEFFYKQAQDNTDVIKNLHNTDYGTKEFAIKDPNGYVLTFAERNN